MLHFIESPQKATLVEELKKKRMATVRISMRWKDLTKDYRLSRDHNKFKLFLLATPCRFVERK